MPPPSPADSPVPCRLYGLLARSAAVGVLLRRGPSAWVQLIRWDTNHDYFEIGQWFHGRVYERRCDLSPDGSKLLYFASKINAKTLADSAYTYAWSAISKPPYFTAVALWPKGDCWHGGGLFVSEREVWLNHRPEQAHLHPDHAPPQLHVTPNPDAQGEDYPIWARRMARDGWQQVQAGRYPYSQHHGWVTERIETWQKPAAKGRLLRYELLGIDAKQVEGSYTEAYSVQATNTPWVSLPDARWADWDQHGRLVFVSEGRLYTALLEGKTLVQTLLADFNHYAPTTIAPPVWARSW